MEQHLDVLIVEDDENIRNMYSLAFETEGLTVTTAATAEDGIAIALRDHPRVILMDIMLPDMKGQDAVEKIRLDNWGKDAKVIYLTNMTDVENVSEAVTAGGREYIIKAHTTPKEVVNTVRTTMHMM